MIPHKLLCKVFASRERCLPHSQLLHLLQPLETLVQLSCLEERLQYTHSGGNNICQAHLSSALGDHSFPKPGLCLKACWSWKCIQECPVLQQVGKAGNNQVIMSETVILRVILPHRNALARCPTKKGPETLKHFQKPRERGGKASGEQGPSRADGICWKCVTHC